MNDEQCYDGRCGPEGTCVGLKSDGAMPPDAGKPDRSVPDTAVPDAARPDLAKPDLAKPDVAKPDAPLLDAPVPDKTPLDAPIPDQTPPDAPLPDQTPPDQLQPDASLCGNGTLDPTELCDGALLGGQTCATQGFTGGKLACEKCQLDTELCYELRDPANLKVGAHATMHALWPQAASDGNGFMVIWQGGSPGGGGFGTSTWIDATLVNAKGKSSASFHVVDTAVGKHHPDLEFGVKDYLVAWDQGTSIRGTTVTPSGKVANPVGTTLTSAYYGVTLPSLAFDGSNFLLAYFLQVGQSHGATGQVWARQITTASKPVGAAFQVNQGSNLKQFDLWPARVAFDGKNHLVVWSTAADILGRRVTPTGKPLGTTNLTISSEPKDQVWPAVAGGYGSMTAWEDPQSGGREIRGAAVSDAGKVAPLVWIETSGKIKYAPALAFDGKKYLVVWVVTPSVIQAIRVDSAGNKVDPAPITLTAKNSSGISYPSVAWGGGQFFVAWGDHRDKSHYRSEIFGTRIRFGKKP